MIDQDVPLLDKNLRLDVGAVRDPRPGVCIGFGKPVESIVLGVDLAEKLVSMILHKCAVAKGVDIDIEITHKLIDPTKLEN